MANLQNTVIAGSLRLSSHGAGMVRTSANGTISSSPMTSADLPSHTHDDRYLPIGGGWYGSGLPGSRWGGYAVNGGEIVFGRDLPNTSQMGILVDGCYIAGENNGFWSLSSDNSWGSRRGMYFDGTYLNFTTNSVTSRFSSIFTDGSIEADGRIYADNGLHVRGDWVRVNGTTGIYFESYAGGWHMTDSSYVRSYNNKSLHMNGASVDYVGSLYLEGSGVGTHLQPNSGSYGTLQITSSKNGWSGIRFTGSNVNLMMNSNESGFHNNDYGWQLFWSQGTGYIHRSTYGGGTQYTILDSGNYSSWAQPISSALNTGNWASYAAPRAYVTDSYVDFYIYGDQNKYYPVTIHNWNGGHGMQRYSVSRGYSWTAPWDPIGTGSHQGGLTFTFEWAGDIAWGGNDKSIRVIEFSETYTTMVAGMQLAHCEGVVVWLRGGGSGGAHYRLHGPGGRSQTYTINMSAWTSCAGVNYTIRDHSGTTMDSEVWARFPIRNSGDNDIYINNNPVATRAWVQAQGYRTTDSDNQTLSISGSTLSISGGNSVTIPSGGITSESDTLATVTGRGNTTSSNVITSAGMYAAVFYDYNNNTYFWDGSAGKSMEVAGGIQLDGLNNSNAYIAFNNASTYWGIIGNYGSNDWRIGIGNYGTMVDWNLRWDASGNAWANSSFRAPIFYDSNDTSYYVDPNSTSNLAASYIGRVLINYDGTDTWFRMQSGNRMRITTTGGTDFIIPNTGNMSYNGNVVWHAGNDGSGSGLDADTVDGFNVGTSTNNIPYLGGTRNLVINDPESYSGEVRLGAAWNRGGVYASNTLSLSTSSGNIDFVHGNNTTARLVGSTGNYGPTLMLGTTSPDYTLIDGNIRPVVYLHGQYPVLTLNHTVTSNGSHGPTIQFTHHTADKQWVIGSNGSGTQLDIGYSTYTANRNPHNGIADYNGSTFFRIDNGGNIQLGRGNGRSTWVNDTLYVGANDSGDAHMYFGEDSSNWYGLHWYWDSGYTVYLYGRNAGSDTQIMRYVTNDNSYVHWTRHFHMNSYDINYVNQIYMETGGQGNYIYANNSGSYGSMRLTSTRNGWYGIYFDSGSTLMMNSNETGFYRQGYGWQWRWENGTAYVNKNSYGGGTSAAVLDSSNWTNYVTTLQGYSAYNLVEEARGVHSGSDFPNGTLVTTDIYADGWSGDSFVMEVSGKSYDSSNSPFKLIMQGYLYADTIINVSAMSYGSYFPGPVKVMRYNGNIAFWWPRGSYWNSFQVHVRDAGGSSWNRVTGISNSSEPNGDKKISITPIQVLHTSNASYAYNMNQNVRTSDGVTFANVSANDIYTTGGWFRNHTNNNGIYWSNTGWHIYPAGTGDLRMRADSSGTAALRMETSGGSVRGYFYANNSNEIGILSEDGNWVLRTWNRGQELYGTTFANDFRTYIIYDRNDTGYYLDMNSTSRLDAAHFNYLSVGQAINTSYRIITNGDYYANGGGNFWAEGRFKQYRGSGTWHDVIDSGNIGSQSVNYASSAAYASESYIVRSTNDYRHSNRSPDSWHGLANSWHFNDKDTVGMSGSDYWVSILTVVPWYGFAGSHRQQQLGFGGSAGLYHRYANDGSSWSGWSRIYSDSYRPYADSAGNADTVDGYHMNQAVTVNASPTFQEVYANGWLRTTGHQGHYNPTNSAHFYANDNSYGAWKITGSRNGWGGINLQDPSGFNHYYMHESGNGGLLTHDRWAWYWHRGNNSLALGDSTTSSSYKVYVTGSLYATGDIVAYSDRRKKTDIVTIEDALEKVKSMRGVFYTKIDESEKGRQVGVIAQEVNEILPEAVTYAADVDEYGVKYGNIVGLLIEAIKEQQKEIDQLKSKLV
jgi:hypothetical protein